MHERESGRAAVWVVDDSRVDAEAARAALAGDFDVSVLGDGADALERLSSGSPPDALVLDWVMPGVNGIEVIRFLRSAGGRLPQVPVLLLTAHHEPGQIAEGLAAGANDFVSKPFDGAELRARVAALLRSARLLDRALTAERALAEVLESSPDVTLAVDARGVVVYANPEAERVFGRSAAELVDSVLTDLMPDFPTRNVYIAPGESLLPLPDVHIGDLAFGPSVRVGASDGAAVTTITLRNVTERRRLERRRLDFYSIIAHELRSPLQAVMSRSDLIMRGKRGQLSSELANDVAIMNRSSRAMLAMINDFLDLARLEGTGLKIDPVHLDMASVVSTSIDELGPLADASRVRLVWEPPSRPAPVHADRARLGQVLANLLGNAIKFTGRGGEVRLAVVVEGPDVLTRVSDTGPGIPADALPHIFERFKRVNENVLGSGLGLTIVREIVEAHGGRVGVESEVGAGSTFWFVLPIARQRDFDGWPLEWPGAS